MPPFETMDRFQTAVLWEATHPDTFGQPRVAAPVEIQVRWKWREALMRDAQGNPVTVDATVVVAQVVPVGSILLLGELTDWYGTGSGSAEQDNQLMEVVSAPETPSIHNRFMRRTLGLAYYKDALPELE